MFEREAIRCITLVYPQDLDDSRSLILQDFPKLKRLCMRIDSLVLRNLSMSAALPPVLEELHLETQDDIGAIRTSHVLRIGNAL